MIRLLALIVALAAPAVLAGCGETGEEKAFAGGTESAREGIAVPIDEVHYTVFITRQLNPEDPEDRQYLVGEPEPPPGLTYYGVFIQVCNESDEPKRTASNFTIEDSRGNHYEPERLSDESVFAYQSRVLAPHDCIPDEAAATAFGPTGGHMLLYRVPVPAVENRPFEIEIEGPHDLLENTQKSAIVELDL